MTRLIDADALIDCFEMRGDSDLGWHLYEVIDEINDAPTAYDVDKESLIEEMYPELKSCMGRLMTPHEQIMINAERYALGRKTYIVGDTVDYIINHINGMSEHCKKVLIADIENPLFDNYGDDIDKAEWMKLLEELRHTTMYCSFTRKPCALCKMVCGNRYCMRGD